MLSNIYPNATGKESAYVTNGDLNEILDLEQFTSSRTEIEKGIDVIMAVSQSSSITVESIIDYAYRPVNTNAYVFDIYSPTVGYVEACSNFLNIVSKLSNKFVVMDINGDVYSPEVTTITEKADVILYVFEPKRSAALAARAYLDSLTADQRLKVKLVCNKWDPTGVSKRTVQDVVKVRSNSILWVPYHKNIQRAMFEKRLCVLNRSIITGDDRCLALRQPLHDILAYIFNSGSIKVIKEVSKWVV